MCNVFHCRYCASDFTLIIDLVENLVVLNIISSVTLVKLVTTLGLDGWFCYSLMLQALAGFGSCMARAEVFPPPLSVSTGLSSVRLEVPKALRCLHCKPFLVNFVYPFLVLLIMTDSDWNRFFLLSRVLTRGSCCCTCRMEEK